MRIRRSLTALLAGTTLLVGCMDLDVTNPNEQSTANFWLNAEDANRGLVATYNALYLLGVFGRWQAFANDIRSDIGTAEVSPWGDLANFNRFQLSDYNFEVNRHLWIHNYELIGRANQVIARVPGIDMDADERERIVAEAKFLRGLAYFNLVTLFENVPLITEPLEATERPAAAAPAETWAQIEQDFSDAADVLPATHTAGNSGRPTRGAALGMLGKARLQQRKWAEAATTLGQVISLNQYSLLPNYGDNFVEARDGNNPESLFEVAMADQAPIGVLGLTWPKMIGPCYRPGNPRSPGVPTEYNPTFCDGRPTRWYYDFFRASRTATGAVDPRLDATILYDDPARANEMVYDRTRGSYFIDNTLSAAREDTMLYFRKYGETYVRADQRWDNPINYKVLRYADVLLMQAEALNESGQTGAAYQHVNAVRSRVGKSALAGLSTAQLRDSILAERIFELGLESSRFNDMRRHQSLLIEGTWAGRTAAQRDRDFTGATTINRILRLPIPTNERNLNPNVPQNQDW